MSAPLSTRDKIIDAAMSIVREQGVAKLTLDEAAKCANLSKGGVLYHFKTKDDLIRGMVERLIVQADALQQSYYDREPEGPYRWARAAVRTGFDPNGPASDKLASALLASIAVNPALVAPLQAQYDTWTARIESDSPNPMLAGMICMAMDGHCFENILGLDLCDNAQREQMKTFMLDLLK
ncbi:MAG: TetR/AcrR family transcriptional regulator [Magnetospirillum sp.]|nr:TetR/AcrR family transcriptional regulator [Magnetospirillum sp.]